MDIEQYNPKNALSAIGSATGPMAHQGSSMKKRKRYQPKTFDGIPPHMIAIMKTSRRSLTVNEIDKAIGPLLKYIDHLKAGTANETDLWAACCTNYLMVELVLILQSTKIQADDTVQEIARIKLSIARDYFVNHVSDTLEAQQIRKNNIGRFVATGDEIKILESATEQAIEILSLADYGHLIQAHAQTAPLLNKLTNDINHRNQKQQQKPNQ